MKLENILKGVRTSLLVGCVGISGLASPAYTSERISYNDKGKPVSGNGIEKKIDSEQEAKQTGPVYSCPNKPEPKISAQAQYTKEQLTYTYEDFLRLRKYPGHEEVLKKIKLICNNPKQAYNYFSEKQKKEFDEFFKPQRNVNKKTGNPGFLSLLIEVFKEAIGDTMVREDYEKTYNGLVNLKEPKLPDKLMIFLHESYLGRWAEESIEEFLKQHSKKETIQEIKSSSHPCNQIVK